MGYLFERYPIAPASDVSELVEAILSNSHQASASDAAILDWLSLEFGLDKPGRALFAPHRLDAGGFVAAIRATLPEKRKLSAAEIARLKAEHRESVEPTRAAAAEILALERRFSDDVNAAYGLTWEAIALMWRRAPHAPRPGGGAAPHGRGAVSAAARGPVFPRDLSPELGMLFPITHRNNLPWLPANGLPCANSDLRAPGFVQITQREKQGNRTRSKVRARVEHGLGAQSNDMGGALLRCIGIVRASAKIWLRNLLQHAPGGPVGRAGRHSRPDTDRVCRGARRTQRR